MPGLGERMMELNSTLGEAEHNVEMLRQAHNALANGIVLKLLKRVTALEHELERLAPAPDHNPMSDEEFAHGDGTHTGYENPYADEIADANNNHGQDDAADIFDGTATGFRIDRGEARRRYHERVGAPDADDLRTSCECADGFCVMLPGCKLDERNQAVNELHARVASHPVDCRCTDCIPF